MQVYLWMIDKVLLQCLKSPHNQFDLELLAMGFHMMC